MLPFVFNLIYCRNVLKYLVVKLLYLAKSLNSVHVWYLSSASNPIFQGIYWIESWSSILSPLVLGCHHFLFGIDGIKRRLKVWRLALFKFPPLAGKVQLNLLVPERFFFLFKDRIVLLKELSSFVAITPFNLEAGYVSINRHQHWQKKADSLPRLYVPVGYALSMNFTLYVNLAPLNELLRD